MAFITVPLLVTAHPTAATLGLISAGLLFSLLAEWLARSLDVGRYRWQQLLRRRFGVVDGKSFPELKWLTLSYQLLLWPFVGFLLLHVWGLHDLGDQFSELLVGGGVKIGSVKFVPEHLLMGILWFVLLTTLGRWVKKKLQQDWLPLAQLEISVRGSIVTLFGYIVVAVSLMVGLSVAGVDLSKIAIVAGALSVGIGFGLQNIFNNFVSGLILLFERPVRLGDYIKIGGMEGFVRRIRIRSTELETWDRTSIIVPNSELLSSKVENTGYQDQTGRVIVSIGVDYAAKPEEVERLLLAATVGVAGIVNAGDVAGLSGPWVLFTDFGASALQFELRTYVSDINKKSTIASLLRYRIFQLLGEAKINIPFPQNDIWLRNWPPSAAVERPTMGP